MKASYFICAVTIATSTSAIYAEDGVCHRCEVIRENNRMHPQNYEYYEDYLKAQGGNTQMQAPANPNAPPPGPNMQRTTRPNNPSNPNQQPRRRSAANRSNTPTNSTNNNNDSNNQNNNSTNNNTSRNF